MRISIFKSDKGYKKDWCNYKVFLGDEELKFCHTADEEKKMAWGYRADQDGELLTSNHKPIDQVWAGKIKVVKT